MTAPRHVATVELKESLGLKADTLLNLIPGDVTKIAHPERGDIALDDGTNTTSGKPGLAVFDGDEWVFMN